MIKQRKCDKLWDDILGYQWFKSRKTKVRPGVEFSRKDCFINKGRKCLFKEWKPHSVMGGILR